MIAEKHTREEALAALRRSNDEFQRRGSPLRKAFHRLGYEWEPEDEVEENEKRMEIIRSLG